MMLTRHWYNIFLHVLFSSLFNHVTYAADYVSGEQLYGTHRLSEYSSFGDVTLFHASIPQDVAFVQWKIITENDNTACPQVNVTIALQRGSIPLINPDNTSFPAHTITERPKNGVILLKFPSNQVVTTSHLSLEAGDWYTASFIDKSGSNKIKQQGLGGVDCKYYIQIGMYYWQLQNVGYLTTKTKTAVELSTELDVTKAVYRFYVPKSLTRSVTFSYEDCKTTPTIETTICPVVFKVGSNRVPDYRFAPVDCNQTDTQCSFLLNEPEDDTWYYVSVSIKIQNVTVNLNLSVDRQTCTEERSTSANFADDTNYIFPPNNSNALPESHPSYNASSSFDPDSRYTSETLVSIITSPSSPVPHSSSLVPSNWCPPVIPLTSAQLSGDNPFKMFFRNAVNSSSGVEVPHSTPIILQFELEPLLDVGGNLMIRGDLSDQMEDGSLGIISNAYITLCLRYGAKPPLNGTTISCDPNYSMTFNSEDSSTAFPWSVPFPEAGVWYLSLESSCESKTGLGPCNSTVLVRLDISLYGCIDECGTYGSCHVTTDSGMRYYYCSCSRGYQGYACTDASEAWSRGYFLSQVLLLTLSNVFFIFPCLLALKRRHFILAISYFCTLLFSTFYHACDSGGWCLMKYDTLQFCDFYAAFMAIFLTLIAMARLPIPLKHSLEILGAFGMALGTSYNRFSIWAAVVPVGVGLVVMLIAWARRWHKRRQCYPTSKWRWILFILPGTAVIITGLCLFAFLETTDNYQYIHSAWHIAMAIGVLFLLPPREKVDFALLINDPLMSEDCYESS